MKPQKIFITGGAGYVGSALVPHLLQLGNKVTVYDNYWYGEVFSNLEENKNLSQIKGDIRDRENIITSARDHDSLIHLACISNDPSFELDAALGKSINYDAFFNVVDTVRNNKISRLIYASSSSVYGVKNEPNVTEDASPNPLTDYSRYKLACEEILHKEAKDLNYTIVRPATVCGYAPRLRLDLVVNILTSHAIEKGRIRVLGGDQLRPNIHIQDMVRAYVSLLESPEEIVRGEAFNAGYHNYTVDQLANIVQRVVGNVEVIHEPTNDNRSYHINSDKIKNVLGFTPEYSIENAVEGIVDAYKKGKIIDGLTNPMYHNIKRMKDLSIK